MQMKVIMHIVW